MRSCGRSALLTVLAVVLAATAALQAQSQADALLAEAKRRETTLRRAVDSRKAGTAAAPLLERARTLTRTYEDIARLFPKEATGDDALWQGAVLAADSFWEFGQPQDRVAALRIFRALSSRYPTSPFVRQSAAHTSRLSTAPPVRPAATAPPVPAATPPAARTGPAAPATMLTAVRRDVLPDALRVTLELEGETAYSDERIEGPPRVVIDLDNTRAIAALTDASLAFPDDVVRQIRVGRPQGARTRVVLDLAGAHRHSVYVLYSPYRVVIDFERPSAATKDTKMATATKETTEAKAAAPRPPVPPVANADGTFSLSRQLGLGVARVVIDPGHGGHDPGAQVKGLNEAELTLDIALRLEKLLVKQRGVEVVLTRRTDAYVPLEERTAVANRSGADLFLSIHANASADVRARGVETYFLNFASNATAEAVAARENAASGRTLRDLPDIVKAIALNDKVDESRDFAAFVQAAMYDRLRRADRAARNLGVKQAPFVVLIGATMPSVLTEISFLTNSQEAALLRTSKYRDQIAEALLNGMMTYQRSLKAAGAVAAQ